MEYVTTEQFLYLITAAIVFGGLVFFGKNLDFEEVKFYILNIYNSIKPNNKNK